MLKEDPLRELKGAGYIFPEDAYYGFPGNADLAFANGFEENKPLILHLDGVESLAWNYLLHQIGSFLSTVKLVQPTHLPKRQEVLLGTIDYRQAPEAMVSLAGASEEMRLQEGVFTDILTQLTSRLNLKYPTRIASVKEGVATSLLCSVSPMGFYIFREVSYSSSGVINKSWGLGYDRYSLSCRA